jgi:hypothetical protein
VRAAGDLAPRAASFLPPFAAFCRLLPLVSVLRLLDLRAGIMLKSVALRGFCSLCVKGGFSLLFLFAALCFPVCASPASVPGIELRCLCFICTCLDGSCARARTICHALAPAQIPKNVAGGLFPQNDLGPHAHLASFKPPFRRSDRTRVDHVAARAGCYLPTPSRFADGAP